MGVLTSQTITTTPKVPIVPLPLPRQECAKLLSTYVGMGVGHVSGSGDCDEAPMDIHTSVP